MSISLMDENLSSFDIVVCPLGIQLLEVIDISILYSGKDIENPFFKSMWNPLRIFLKMSFYSLLDQKLPNSSTEN